MSKNIIVHSQLNNKKTKMHNILQFIFLCLDLINHCDNLKLGQFSNLIVKE